MRRGARPSRLVQLGGGRQQGAPVHECPAHILRIGQLQALRPEGLGQRDDLLDVTEVLPVQHHVERQGESELLDPARHFQLPLEGAQPGDTVRARRRDVLDRYLHVVESEGAEAREALTAQGDTARDEIGVEVDGPGALDEGLQIVPEERLATREVELDDPELLGLAKHAEPVRRVEPVRVAPVVHGVRAVHAAERAPVRQLGDERIRTVLVAHGPPSLTPRPAGGARNDMTSRSTCSRGWEAYFSASPSTIAWTGGSPVHRVAMSAAVGVSTSPRSG